MSIHGSEGLVGFADYESVVDNKKGNILQESTTESYLWEICAFPQQSEHNWIIVSGSEHLTLKKKMVGGTLINQPQG